MAPCKSMDVRARTTVAAALATVLVAALAACGGPSADDAAVSRGPAGPTGATGASASAGREPFIPLAPAPATPTTLGPPVEAPPLPLNGCPPPPPKPGTTPPGPAYVPPRLVPEAELPEPVVPGPWTASTDALAGKGMWLWKVKLTENGDPDAIVNRAAAAGLRQLWVRVGDSQSRFYAKDFLDQIVPLAHRRGIAVIGWGFPYLFDPVDDARWSVDALTWRGPRGETLDGFSPDLELNTEGVAVSERRLGVYLGLVRQAAANRLVVATVYRPTDRLWSTYPYQTISAYVDAFAPMVYWGCLEPGTAALQAIDRLKTLRPVHTIGQAYDSTADGGRTAAPNAHETNRFLDVSRRQGALGASFWVWQYMDDEQWTAMSAFGWP